MKSNGIIYIFWTLVSMMQISLCLGKAYPNVISSTNQYFESLCNNETNNERFVESDGRRSSFFLELRSNQMMPRRKSCERNFTTSESHGFIIRLIVAKNKLYNPISSSSSSSSSSTNSNINSNTMLNSQRNHGKSMTFKNSGTDSTNKYHEFISHQNKNQLNSTRSCPLTIYSNNDYNYQEALWQVDPCELEKDDSGYGNENNWPVKFFEGHIKIHWEHNHNSIHSKLMITALGKGEDGCKKSNKFPCLKFGGSAFFCISKDLICDNIRHCPNGNLYDDDEDKKMCEKLHSPPILSPTTVIFDNEWEQQLMLWMQHAFGDLTPSLSSSSSSEFGGFDDVLDKEYHDGRPTTIIQDRPYQKDNNGIHVNEENDDDNEKDKKSSVTTATTTTITTRKNISRNTLTGDLSKYGPWGYLMLGMLLCGGALLICGLWECCCRNNKNESHITASTIVGNTTSIQDTIETQSARNQNNITPPNYDELDPPPAYSVLFPNQKATATSSGIESSSELPPPPPPILSSIISARSGSTGIRNDSMVTVPVVVVVPGGARSNNINNNSNNSNNNNPTSDLTPVSSS